MLFWWCKQHVNHRTLWSFVCSSCHVVISFPDLLWMKPKARSGKVRKFVFLDWLLHLTPVQSPLSKLTLFSAANFFRGWWKWKADEKSREGEDLEVLCHSGLNNFCNMILPLPKSQTRHPARAQAPLHLPLMLFWHKTLQTLPLIAFLFALTRSPNLRKKTACGELIPEAF